MPLDLFIAGPGLQASRRLAVGEPALILGRDADCSVCLPDPERNVSRRHLSAWNEGEALHFLVVSVVNGVEVEGVEVPPAGRGVLRPGEVLALADYRITVQPVAAAPAPESDPWADFEKEAARLVASVAMPAAPAEDDPFGDWGFQSTFGPGAVNGALEAGALEPGGDLESFFIGLGVERRGGFTRGELETMGRLTRAALRGLLQAQRASGGNREALRSDDRTVLEPRETNPLRMDTPLESKLWYLFGGQAAAAGSIPADRAVGEVVNQLLAHQEALAEAVRQTVAAVLQDFAPEALKARLLGPSPKLFESARAWDAFAKDYTEKGQDLDGWVRQLLDRHFAEAYAQALLRAKRHSEGPPRG
ncbi:FHA domain-containing protein [Ramlibacter sp. G-1-2-2]|uniref:FHA domain-containing protein n=1 Tax=Ramlibacter agri TaxID=2728837 RepID=A0A848HE98_9BURK|nr:type VI secretion system-associated FHA domain protein [Ramlibacter agri]NML45898.1 FHA domain-containing protein [Ramlibacter agri]